MKVVYPLLSACLLVSLAVVPGAMATNHCPTVMPSSVIPVYVYFAPGATLPALYVESNGLDGLQTEAACAHPATAL